VLDIGIYTHNTVNRFVSEICNSTSWFCTSGKDLLQNFNSIYSSKYTLSQTYIFSPQPSPLPFIPLVLIPLLVKTAKLESGSHPYFSGI
jgi:hypothetical protein